MTRKSMKWPSWANMKKAYDDSIRDLDDVYFEVQRREEKRRKQGWPSLIGVLPVNDQPLVSERGEPDDEAKMSDASQDSLPKQHQVEHSQSLQKEVCAKFSPEAPA